MLKYLYLERSRLICRYGDGLSGREECECVRVYAFVFVCVYVYLSLCTSMYIYVIGMEGPAISLLASYLAVVVTDRMKFLLQKE